jgi:hypothetical protein
MHSTRAQDAAEPRIANFRPSLRGLPFSHLGGFILFCLFLFFLFLFIFRGFEFAGSAPLFSDRGQSGR